MPTMIKGSSKPIVGRSVFKLDTLLQDGAHLVGRIGPWDETSAAPREAECALRLRRAGHLRLPTGRLIACDPFAGPPPSEPPFAHRFEPGRYAVWLTEALGLGPTGPLTAAAFLRVRSGTPSRWKLATHSVSRKFAGPRLPSISVDVATAALYDFSAVARFREVVETAGNFDDVIASTDGGLVLDRATKANIIVFPTGWGDGGYLSWLGFDREDRLIMLMIDFEVFTTVESLCGWASAFETVARQRQARARRTG